MHLESSFDYLVQDVGRLYAQRFNQQSVSFLGLNRSQCRILGYLTRYEGINQAGLAELLEIKPMTLVRQIDRMEADGWIERRPDPADRRARRLVLTKKARPILARIHDLSSEVRQVAFASLSDEEGCQLVDLLRRVYVNLSGHPAIAAFARPTRSGQPSGPQRSDPGASGGTSAVGAPR